MTKTVVIVESPAKCKKIESFLGPGFKCIASFGHLRGFGNGLKSIDVDNNFRPSYQVLDGKDRYMKPLRQAITNSDEVILATDDDREGEAIAWHICDEFDLPVSTTKRIIFHEITKKAIQDAVKTPTVVNMDMVHAQQARQILDLIVGYKLSPILWKNISRNSKEGLSAGRCQTPALRLVYDNYNDIKSSPGKKVYNTIGYFTKHNLPFQLNNNFDNEESMGEFLEESVEHKHKFSLQPVRNTKKKPPTPFTTSALQQTSSNELHISPKETMKLAQTLYEGGFITYMRTDSKTYSEDFVKTVKKRVTEKWGEEYIFENIDSLTLRVNDNKEEETGKDDSDGDGKKGTKKGKKSTTKGKKGTKKPDNNAQEAHEAIRPTNILLENVPEEMQPRERKLYHLIWKHTLESCMATATYKAVTAKITAAGDETNEYRYSTEQVVFPGWKVVGGYEKENPIFSYLKTLKKNSVLEYKKITSKVSLKDLKMHYTEAKLVQLLENKGIGRPSTFSSLIDKIQDRGYVKKQNVKGQKIMCVDFELEGNELNEIENEREFGNEKNKLVIQPLGIMVIEFLVKNFDELFVYEYTKKMEDSLDLIAKQQMIWHNLCQQCLDIIVKLSKDVIGDRQVIKIDDYHTYMIGKYGPVIKYEVGEKVSFKKVKKDIDLERLKNGEYKLEEIIETGDFKGRLLGRYSDEELYLKKGKFGLFVTWGDNKKSLNFLKKEESEIELDDILPILKQPKNPNILRELNENISIRNGKYGAYIFFKTPAMKKPRFLKLKGFEDDYGSCANGTLLTWIKETYKVG